MASAVTEGKASTAPSVTSSAGHPNPLDRFVVISLLEDLHFPCCSPPSAWRDSDASVPVPSASLSIDGGEDNGGREEGLLTAGSATEANEESQSRRKSRLRALRSLNALASRLGPKWAAAEIPAYLQRCVEEDDPELSRTVAAVIPGLIAPTLAHVPQNSAPQTSQQHVRWKPTISDPMMLSPVLSALMCCSDPVARELVCVHTFPKCCFGVSMVDFVRWNDPYHPIDSGDVVSCASADRGVADATSTSSSPKSAEVGAHVLCSTTPWASVVQEATECVDPFERRLALDLVLKNIEQWMDTEKGSGRTKFHMSASHALAFLHSVMRFACRWPNGVASVLRLVSVLSGSISFSFVHPACHASIATVIPKTELELRHLIVWVTTRHVTSILLDPVDHTNPTSFLFTRFLHCLFAPTSPQRGIKSLKVWIPEGDTFVVAKKALEHPAICTAVIRAIPFLCRPLVLDCHWPALSASSASRTLESVLVQQQEHLMDLGGDALSTDVQSYAQRHDDSIAGSSFAVFHALVESVQGNIERMAHMVSVLAPQGGDAQAALQQWLRVTRLLVTRGAHFSSWKHRFLILRRAGLLFDVCIDFTLRLMFLQRQSTWNPLAPFASYWQQLGFSGTHVADRSRSTSSTPIFLIMDLLQRDVVFTLMPELCGDGEVEVRCAVGRHAADPLVSAAKLIAEAASCVLSSTSPTKLVDAAATEEAKNVLTASLLSVAHGVISVIQVCAMDVNERVRAASATSIAAILMLYSTGPPLLPEADRERGRVPCVTPAREVWQWITEHSDSGKIIDAVMAILMDLLRDDHHMVQLSVMHHYGEVILAAAAAEDSHAPASPHSANAAASMVSRLEHEVAQMCGTLQRNPVWRVRESYAVFLSRLIGSLMKQCRGARADRLLEHLAGSILIPLMVELLFDPVKAVRDTSLSAIVQHMLPTSDARGELWRSRHTFVNELLWPLVKNHPRSMSTYLMRGALLNIAMVLGVDEERYLLPLFDRLGKDGVPNVRLMVSKVIAALLDRKESSSLSSPYEGTLVPLLRGLLEDPCADVREHASLAFLKCK